MKPSLGVGSEHRFQDTVEEHDSLGFPADNRFIFLNCVLKPVFPIPGFGEHINLPLKCDVSDEGFRIPSAVAPKNRLEIGGQKPV